MIYFTACLWNKNIVMIFQKIPVLYNNNLNEPVLKENQYNLYCILHKIKHKAILSDLTDTIIQINCFRHLFYDITTSMYTINAIY